MYFSYIIVDTSVIKHEWLSTCTHFFLYILRTLKFYTYDPHPLFVVISEADKLFDECWIVYLLFIILVPCVDIINWLFIMLGLWKYLFYYHIPQKYKMTEDHRRIYLDLIAFWYINKLYIISFGKIKNNNIKKY
jgi:hypothetical protein